MKSKEEAIDALAARLVWKMEQLDPALADAPDWERMTERQKSFYRLCVADLVEFDGLLRAIFCTKDNDDSDASRR